MKKIVIVLTGLICLGACMTLPTSSEYATRGDGYVKDGKMDKAITAYNKALELNPDNLEVYASRGAAHYFMGHFDLAQQDFEHALKANPYHSDTYTAYGSVLAARGDYKNALTILNMALELNPTKPENYFSRAGVYFMLQDYPKALADYTTVLQVAPARDVLNARGATYLRMGKENLAEQDFKAAKEGDFPDTLSVYSQIK